MEESPHRRAEFVCTPEVPRPPAVSGRSLYQGRELATVQASPFPNAKRSAPDEQPRQEQRSTDQDVRRNGDRDVPPVPSANLCPEFLSDGLNLFCFQGPQPRVPVQVCLSPPH